MERLVIGGAAARSGFSVPGPAGAPGAPGTPGAVWYSGAGAPAVGLGVNGDYYLNTTTDHVPPDLLYTSPLVVFR